MNRNNIIGVWGYGKVGKSLVQFFSSRGHTVYVLDKNETVAQALKKEFPAAVFFHESQNFLCDFQKRDYSFSFFSDIDLLHASPGVDIILHYHLIKDKLRTEVDLFFTEWQKPIIAITGSVGKTTVTSFLSSLLNSYGLNIATGGNIGTPLLELLPNQQKTDYAVVELSSFQLEHSIAFCPDIAVWTNFYPNHLDRHGIEENYFKAKYQLLARQTADQKAIVPTSLISLFDPYGWPKSSLFFVQDEERYSQSIKGKYPLFSYNNNVISYTDQHSFKQLLNVDDLPAITVTQNWLFLTATLHAMNILDNRFVEYAQKIIPIPHRTEFVTTIDNVTFINDSKSTTIASTVAAVQKYKNKRVTLIVGGLSKGVDRTPLFEQVATHVTHVITFGAEAVQLHAMCTQQNISSFSCTNLEEAVQKAIVLAAKNGIILFSPAGSSYDLFSNYEERGNAFKKIILDFYKEV